MQSVTLKKALRYFSWFLVVCVSKPATAAVSTLPSKPIYFGTEAGTIDVLSTAGQVTTVATGLGDPMYGLACDGQGNVYASFNGGNPGTTSIFRIAPDGTRTSYASGIERATGMVFDRYGNLFATDEAYGRIYEIQPGGAKSLFATLPSPDAEGLAFDSAGNLYAASNSSKIFRISPSGSVSTFSTIGTGGSVGIAIDSANNLYVTNDFNWIYKIDAAGNSNLYATGATNATAAAIDDNGTLYVADRGAAALVAYPASTQTGVAAVPGVLFIDAVATAPTAVPEPSTVAIGLVGLLATVRRGTKRSGIQFPAK